MRREISSLGRAILAVCGAVTTAIMLAATTAYADPLVITTTTDGSTLANALIGTGKGLAVNGATYTGAADSAGIFSGGTSVIGFESGIILSTGDARFVQGLNTASAAGINNGAAGTSLFSNSFNASILTINFTPTSEQVRFTYVFGSEEYNKYVNAGYNDSFRFFVNGVNYALIPGTNTPVEVDSVNLGANNSYFTDNTAGRLNTQLNGLTTVLSFIAPVNTGIQNTLQLAIADRGDALYDSAVFIRRGDLQACGGSGPAGQILCAEQARPMPEPAAMILLGTGLVGVGAAVRRRRKGAKEKAA